MMFIVSLTYKVAVAAVDKHLEGHKAFLDKYFADGTFILAGRKVPRTGGVIIACVETRQKLDEILAEDPFFSADVASFDVTELAPTKASAELAYLVNN